MDSSIVYIVAAIIIILIIAVATEVAFTIIGAIIGFIVFFAPLGLIAFLGEKLHLHGIIVCLLSIAWIIIGCMFLDSIFEKL